MEPPSSVLAKAIAAFVAGLLAFALTAGGFLLMGGLFDGWFFLALSGAVPAALIALLPLSARIFCFAIGLVAMAGTALLDANGPDNPMIVFAWIAMCIAGAAVVAELCVRAAGALPGPRTTEMERRRPAILPPNERHGEAISDQPQ